MHSWAILGFGVLKRGFTFPDTLTHLVLSCPCKNRPFLCPFRGNHNGTHCGTLREKDLGLCSWPQTSSATPPGPLSGFWAFVSSSPPCLILLNICSGMAVTSAGRFYMGAYRGQCPCKNVLGPCCGLSWAYWIIKLKPNTLIKLLRFYILAAKTELMWLSILHGVIRAMHPNTVLPGEDKNESSSNKFWREGATNVLIQEAKVSKMI